MKYLSQNDPRWASKKLGASDSTVGDYGCTTTCISMLSDYFGGYKSPLEIASNAANYLRDLIKWTSLKFDTMEFEWREYGFKQRGIDAALKNPDRAVILEVPISGGRHWVVAARRSYTGNDYIIIDPWDGKKKSLYKNYRSITGAAYFKRKHYTAPTQPVDVGYGKELAQRDYPYFLQMEQHGELWAIHPDGTREYLPDGEAMLQFMRKHATGIKDENLHKIPLRKDK